MDTISLSGKFFLMFTNSSQSNGKDQNGTNSIEMMDIHHQHSLDQ